MSDLLTHLERAEKPMADRKRYRDAITGEYVDEQYATDHPDTTVAETVDTPSVILDPTLAEDDGTGPTE